MFLKIRGQGMTRGCTTTQLIGRATTTIVSIYFVVFSPPVFFGWPVHFRVSYSRSWKSTARKFFSGFFLFLFFVFRFSVGQVFKSLRASGFLDGLQLVSVTCLDCNSIHLFCTQSCSSKFVFIFSERQTSCWCQKDNWKNGILRHYMTKWKWVLRVTSMREPL